MGKLEGCCLAGHQLLIESDDVGDVAIAMGRFKALIDYYKYPHCDKTPAEKAKLCGNLEIVIDGN